MRIYRCKLPWFSGLKLTLLPRCPEDYGPAEDMDQAGLTGEQALERAFVLCHEGGRDMHPGDIVELDDGSFHRCEMVGWTDTDMASVEKT